MKLSHIVKMLAVAALVVCLFSIGNLLVIRSRYRTAEKLYEDAAESYTQPAVETPTGSDEDAYAEQPVQRREDCAPIVVDFAALQEINSDVFAWIYCEDSVINYPVVHSFDNDYYLEHAFNKEDSPSGAIFSDYRNSFGVQDANTILYGHHMQILVRPGLLRRSPGHVAAYAGTGLQARALQRPLHERRLKYLQHVLRADRKIHPLY